MKVLVARHNKEDQEETQEATNDADVAGRQVRILHVVRQSDMALDSDENVQSNGQPYQRVQN